VVVRPELPGKEAPGIEFLKKSGSTSAKFVGGEPKRTGSGLPKICTEVPAMNGK